MMKRRFVSCYGALKLQSSKTFREKEFFFCDSLAFWNILVFRASFEDSHLIYVKIYVGE